MPAPAHQVATMLAPATHRLVLQLMEQLQSPGEGVHEASQRLCRHLLEHYRMPDPCNDARSDGERLALAPWQERKAKEILAGCLLSRLYIADVAEQCGLSRSHFSRAFKQATGFAPREWALRLRIDRARELLASGDAPISQVGQECGFADQSHFCRSFRKLVGCTPNRWRQASRVGGTRELEPSTLQERTPFARVSPTSPRPGATLPRTRTEPIATPIPTSDDKSHAIQQRFSEDPPNLEI
ncbi:MULTISPECIES: helix-turn-helix transcriptional regulator [Pseudomonas]|uniref:helix-turn-helix transcriptional regulator n=1 Tax=Pseudomonas nitroreducens TaxID=46680 RepID=UPI00187618A1|nr:MULTISPECIES: AraC family transcriptional regulator [Pseudomonas]MCJ1878073.1 AraC family transcriptional regulator [Pseudomonas nitroreducens]MCJ1894470.1 AraC family transcriptional regulator [Pseudomonas nitroreducens]